MGGGVVGVVFQANKLPLRPFKHMAGCAAMKGQKEFLVLLPDSTLMLLHTRNKLTTTWNFATRPNS